MNKKCNYCFKEKGLEDFPKLKSSSDGYRKICKECRNKTNKKYKIQTQNRNKLYYQNNKEKFHEHYLFYYEQNKEIIKQQSNEYYHENKNNPDFYNNINRNLINQKKKNRRQKRAILREQRKIQEMIDLEACSPLEKQCSDCKILKIVWKFSKQNNGLLGRKTICKNCQSIYRKNYQIENKDILAEKQKVYNEQIHRKIANRLRARMRKAVKNYQANKKETTFKYLGCSISNFVNHLEKQFTSDMNWTEFLKGSIHIDHILPLCQFDLSQEENLYKACNYNNLRPLWNTDNISKCAQDRLLSIH